MTVVLAEDDVDIRDLVQIVLEQLDLEVRAVGTEPRQGLTTVGRLDDAEAIGLERLDEHLPQRGLVVDDEDRPCHLCRQYRCPC